jgi:hypothetical protein
MDDFSNGNIPNSFSELKSFRIGNLLTYNLMFGKDFPCFNMVTGEEIIFLNTVSWNSFTSQGTGSFSLDLINDKLICDVNGSIFNLKIFDVNGKMIKWFPVVFGSGVIMYEVIDATQNGTLPNSLGWDSQNIFDYNGVYGSFDSEPSKYLSRLKRTYLSVTGTPINNQSKLKTIGDLAFKAMSFTKS